MTKTRIIGSSQLITASLSVEKHSFSQSHAHNDQQIVTTSVFKFLEIIFEVVTQCPMHEDLLLILSIFHLSTGHSDVLDGVSRTGRSGELVISND